MNHWHTLSAHHMGDAQSLPQASLATYPEGMCLRLLLALALVTFAMLAPVHADDGALPQAPPRLSTEGLRGSGLVAVPDEAAFVDLSHAHLIFSSIETWLAQGDAWVPMPPVYASDLAGVKVTLRQAGVTLATGEQWLSPVPLQVDRRDTLGRPVADLTHLAQQAIVQALTQLQVRLAAPNMTGEQLQERLRDLGPRLLVDLQIARRPRPVLIASTDPESAALFSFVPGYHGLILSLSNQPETAFARIWPASALAENLQPLAQMQQLLKDLDCPESDLKTIARPTSTGIAPAASTSLHLARFEIIHLVRPSWSDPPLEMVRGQPLLPTVPVTMPTLESMSARMTDYLLTRVQADGHVTGLYIPATDRFENEQATWPETALLGYCLAKRLHWLTAVQTNSAQIASLQQALRPMLEYLQPVDGSAGPAQRDPATAALYLMTLPLLSPEAGYSIEPAKLAELAQRLMNLRMPEGGYESQFNVRQKPANLPAQALMLAALAQVANATNQEAWQKLLQADLDRLWKENAPGPLATAMPWLAAAEFAMRDKDDSGQVQTLDDARARRIHALAKTLRSQLIRQVPDMGPADVVGGFDVTPRLPESAPYPDWRGGQFLAFWALALAQPEFRQGPDMLPWVLDCGLAARFMGQLMVTEAGCYAVRRPGEVLGGVRLSLWDQRVGVPATAMSLLALTQLQSTLHELQKDAR